MGFERNSLTLPNVLYMEEMDALMESRAIKKALPAQSVLYKPGDKLGYVYYIKSGRTKHFLIHEDGSEKMLYTLSQGWFFGECMLFLNNQENAGVHCIYSATEIPSEIYKIEHKTFAILLDQDKNFRDAVFHSCARKIMILAHEVENLSFTPCKDRLKRLFCSLVDKGEVEDRTWFNIKISYTHYDLGVIIGASRVTVSRLMQELCSENFLRVINRRTQVNVEQYAKYMGNPQKH